MKNDEQSLEDVHCYIDDTEVSIEECDGLILSKNGFNIWAQIESVMASVIISKTKVILPRFPALKPRK